MHKYHIITTAFDTSLPLFFTQNITKKLIPSVSLYEDFPLNGIFPDFDYIYFRDPFHGNYSQERIKKVISYINQNAQNAYIIDAITSYEEILMEDKWLQYKKYEKFMPQTQLFDLNEEYKQPKVFKKRLSSRSKGIHFSASEISHLECRNYIAQERINFEKEYRVYATKNEIFQVVIVRQSKTEGSKTKNLYSEIIQPDLYKFVQLLAQEVDYDIYGLDIGYLRGNYFLLEVNRSPQWLTYYSLVGVNLSEILVDSILVENT
ncbi:hypothetical protein IT418_01650 [bacterium]|nr:hypothetical protein [bacterium]